MKKRNLLLCMFALLVSLAAQADIIAYAQYANGTLTFRYGEFTPDGATSWDASDTGDDPGMSPAWKFSLANAGEMWVDKVKKVVFDPSFASARPKTCFYWFDCFRKLETIEGLEYFNTSEVTSMSCMFEVCEKLKYLDLSTFDTGKVTDMTAMFAGCTNLKTVDLSNFETAQVTSMGAMFAGQASVPNTLKTILVGYGWSTDGLAGDWASQGMFDYCPNLMGGFGTKCEGDGNTDKTYACVDSYYSPGYLTMKDEERAYAVYENGTLTFKYDAEIPEIDNWWNVGNTGVPDNYGWGGTMWSWSTDLLTRVVFEPSFVHANPVSCYAWFDHCRKLESIEGLAYLNTSSVVSMGCMFEACENLRSLNLSRFDTRCVEDMGEMFAGCNSLKTLDLTTFDTRRVTNMQWMFAGLENTPTSLENIYVGDNWNVDNVEHSEFMFEWAISLVGGNGTSYDSEHLDKTYARIDAPGTPGYLSRRGTDSSPLITFVDPKVKNLCVINWDTNCDGELSLNEAAAVPTLGGAFRSNKEITSFDELQYFTGLTSINSHAFGGCSGLQSVIMPSTVTSLENGVFNLCSSLKRVSMPGGVKLGLHVFSWCGELELITISDLEAWCASDKDEWFVAPNSYPGYQLFVGDEEVKELVIPSTMSTVKEESFTFCRSITSVVIPDGVTEIQGWAFFACENLASVTIPGTVTSIGTQAFEGCRLLTTITIPASVANIGLRAFDECESLTSVTVGMRTPLTIDENTFSNRANATLYVPAGCKAAYEAADYWKEFQEIVEAEAEETELWSGSYEIRDWNYLGIAAEDLTSLMVGDVLHVAVTDVLESEAYVALCDGNWRTLEAWYGVSPDKTEAVFTLTGDMVRALKERGMVLTCHGYTVTRVYTTPAYDGGRYSVWLGRQTGGDVVVDICHFQNSNRNTGVKAGDSIRLTYGGEGMPRLGYSGEDNGWQWTELPGTLVERIGVGADLTVTGDMAKLLNNNNLIIQLADGGLTLTVVELVSGANTVVYRVQEGETFASGTEIDEVNITLTYGETGGPDFRNPVGWTCSVEGYDFDFYMPGNGVNGNREGGTFYVFKPKKNGLLTVVVRQNANKALYVEESGEVMADFNGVVRGEHFRGGYTFEVKANRTYKVYCTGSKLGFYGFIYDWLDNADLINIDFACDYTKQICVAAFDTNGDGELSEAEAAAVTDEQFKTQLHGTGEAPESMSFDELQYFTGLTVMPQGRFAGVKYLTSIILPESMTSIETNAFRGCERLATVGLPLGLQTLGECAFLGSGITSIKLPAGVKEIPSQCFLNCRSLADVDFGSVERIGDGAFARSGITSVSLPFSVKWVGNEAFKNCPNLQGYVDLAYIEHLGAEAFSACPLITMTSIPPTIVIDENSWGAFSGCTGLETVEFFAGTTRIDNLTFEGCQNLRNLPYGLPSTLESIGHDAFSGCALSNIVIPKGVTTIQENAFKDCNNLIAVVMENPVPIVLENAETFSNRQNATLVVPAGSEEAYRQADVWREFGAITSFVDIVENGNLETDDTGCFFAKHAEQSDEVVPATIADGEGTDGSRCLAITSIDDPVNVWDTQFFVRMPQLLQPGTIYHVSFDYRASRDGQVNLECHGEPTEYLAPYTSLWFGTDWQHFDYTGVITAEQSHDDIAMRTIAFTLGENRVATTFYLDNIVFEIDQTHQVENIINFEDPRVKQICVNNWDLNGDGELSESEAARVTALGQVFRDNHEITTFRELQHFVGLTDISECAFEGCWNLTAVELPRHVTVIRHDAFTLTGLQTIDLFNVKKLEYCAFLNSALTELYIPGTVTDFDGWSQFNGCPNLKRVEFGDGAENLCNAVFENSPELEEVILPASLDGWMGASLLGNCPKLKRVEIRSGNSSMTHTFLMGGGDTDNQVHFVVPDGTADEFLKKGFVNLSDLSALPEVKNQLTYEAQSVEALLDAGEYTASSEAVAALREAIGNARSAEVQGYTDVLQNIDLLHSHAKAFMKQATFNPGVDVTALLVQNPAFYSYPFGWNVTPNGAVSTLYNESRMENAEAYVDHFVERWTYEGDADQAAEKLDDGGITQTITQLPAGKYRLEATVIASNNHDNCPATGAFLVAGTNSVEVGTMPALPERASLEFTQAEDGDCTVGLELVGTTANWVALDNVRIYCLGSVDAPVGQTADHLYAEAVELRAGAVAEVALNLSNEKTYTAYQFDLLLPEGIDIATDENGKLLVAKGDRYTDASQRLKVEKTADNTYQFLCVSMSNAELTGNDGTILTFTLKADGSLPTGAELQALLQQVKLVQPDGTLLTAPDAAIGISITRPLKPGDANDDGDIDVADPVAMINYILGRPTVKFLFAAADVNQDNQVDVFDVMKVINMTFAKNAARQLGRLLEPSADQMTIDGFNIEVGETKTLGIALANTAAYAGFQFSLVLPQGITVKSYAPTSRIPADIGVSMQQQTDGSYLFIGTAWEEDVTLVGNSGAIIDITVTADDTMAEGALTGYFRSVKLSDANGVGVTYQEMSFPINSMRGLELALASGWNWISTSQADASQRDARTFLSPIVDDVLRLLSQTQELVNDGQYGIVGNLQTLEVGSAYKLNTNKATTLSLKGETADVAATHVHLSKGWNWLGYVPTVALPVATAFENLQASADDRIISLTDGVAAYDGSAWVGDFTMRPGEGYLYFAHADVDFVYSSATSAPAGSRPQVEAPSPAPWFCDVHQYPDVTTIIATVSTGGESAWSGSQSLQVGAFCGDECRGIARWVDGLLFLAVHGTQGRGETITFRAADAETGAEMAFSEQLTFNGQCEGTLSAPMQLTLSSVITAISPSSLHPQPSTFYTLDGRMVGRQWRSLPEGVYVMITTFPDGTTARQKVMKK